MIGKLPGPLPGPWTRSRENAVEVQFSDGTWRVGTVVRGRTRSAATRPAARSRNGQVGRVDKGGVRLQRHHTEADRHPAGLHLGIQPELDRYVITL
jgi:hypothetical protein